MQFLHHVLPPIGPYCFTLIKNGVVNQQFIDSIPTDDELAEFITDHANCDSYFALASFQTPTKRTQANVAKLKALWLDLDIGGKSTYSNKDAARQALVAFYKAAGLPKPTVVDSGGGYHVYWTLTRAIDVAEWKALVLALLNKATEHNFSIKDVGVSKDCARILRLPNSYNHKFEEPRQVEIKTVGVPTDPDTLRELLNAGPAVPLLPKVRTNLTSAALNNLSPLTRSLMAHTGQQYGPVIARSMQGTGCVQLANGYLNQEDLTGMHWWALLSIPQFTEQRQDAVHNLSYQHSNYSITATLFKVAPMALMPAPKSASIARNSAPLAVITGLSHTLFCLTVRLRSARAQMKALALSGAEVRCRQLSTLIYRGHGPVSTSKALFPTRTAVVRWPSSMSIITRFSCQGAALTLMKAR